MMYWSVRKMYSNVGNTRRTNVDIILYLYRYDTNAQNVTV